MRKNLKSFLTGCHQPLLALLSSVAIVPMVHAQSTAEAPVLTAEDIERERINVAPPRVGAITLDQQFSLNGVGLDFSEGLILALPFEDGTGREPTLDGTISSVATVDNEEAIDASPAGLRFSRSQRASVVQLNTMDRQRTIVSRVVEPGDLLGTMIDLSLTGRCFLPDGSSATDFCTYTPGLATSPDDVDPNLLTPTGFLVSSNFGQIIPEATHQSLFAPGFQRGEDVVGGPLVGLDLDVLNTGFVRTSDSPAATGTRHEETEVRLIPVIARVEQNLSSNSESAAASRTTRAFVLPHPDDITPGYFLMELAALALPAASADVAYTADGPNVNVSNNLFRALSNARVPAGSYVIFETGRAEVAHLLTPARSAAETPVASYFGFSLNMSPVREVTSTGRLQFVPTGDREIVSSNFAEGGFGTSLTDLVDIDGVIVNLTDIGVSGLNLEGIDDLYVQSGVALTTQNADRVAETTEVTRIGLKPHLAVNGNLTGGEYVFRYYSGVIFDDNQNAYVGADYTLATETGWNAYARLDLYSDPDLDYRSELELRASKRMDLADGRQLTVGVGQLTDLDIDEPVNGTNGTLSEEIETNAFVSLGNGTFDATVLGRLSQNVSGLTDESATISLGYRDGNGFSVTAQATPYSTFDSFVESAVGINYRFSEMAGEPVLTAQLARIRHDVGQTSEGRDVTDTETIFQAGFQMKF